MVREHASDGLTLRGVHNYPVSTIRVCTLGLENIDVDLRASQMTRDMDKPLSAISIHRHLEHLPSRSTTSFIIFDLMKMVFIIVDSCILRPSSMRPVMFVSDSD
jgi:hypothetical protein